MRNPLFDRPGRGALAGLLLFLPTTVAASAQVTTIYVDPVAGVPGAPGTISQPVATITQAVGMISTPLGAVQLKGGAYSESTGEVFPITIPSSIDVFQINTIPGEEIASIGSTSSQGGGAGTLGAGLFDVQATDVRFSDLALSSGGPCIRFQPTFGSTVSSPNASLQIDRVTFEPTIGGATGVVVLSSVDSVVGVTDCEFTGFGEAGIELVPLAEGDIDATVQGCHFRDLGSGIWVRLASFTAKPTLLARMSTFSRCTNSGISALKSSAVTSAAYSEITVEHCVFFDNVKSSFFPTNADLAEDDGHGRFRLYNSIFAGTDNLKNLPTYDAATDIIDSCMFVEPALIGINGSIAGPPRMVDPVNGDFHLRPVSPLIGAGTPTASIIADVDGQIFGSNTDFCVQTGTEIGVDEHTDRYIYSFGETRIGGTARMRVLGPPGSAARVLMVDGSTPSAPCDPLASSFVIELGTPFTLDAGGYAQHTIPIPADPAFIGASIYLTAAIVPPGGQPTSARNVAEIVISD